MGWMAKEPSSKNVAQIMAVTGSLMYLARHSELHAAYRIAQLMDRVFPSIQRGHFCLYTNRTTGQPVGFCNWVMVSEEVLGALLTKERDIAVKDWDTGDVPFFPEMIAPYGHLRKIIADLRNNAMLDVPWAFSIRGRMIGDDGSLPEQRTFKWKCGRGRKLRADMSASDYNETKFPLRLL